MSERRPILLLVNPISGGKIGSPGPLEADSEALEPGALLAALEAKGLDVTLRVLEAEDDPGKLAGDAALAGMDVVAAGGDGTVGPVAAALCGTEATLGIVALGSWNNVAQAYRIPHELDSVVAAIGDGRGVSVDVGLAWHPADDAPDDEEPPDDAIRFFEAAGVGLDAAWFGAAELGERHGWWRALRSIWRAMRRRRTGIRLVVDGRTLSTAAPAVTVCNGPYMGMGFAIAPDADPADGRLNIVVFSGMTRFEVIRHYLSVARRRPRREPRTRRLTGKRVTIAGTRRVLPAHADGRSVGTTPIRLAVDPGALRIFRLHDD